MLSTPPTDLSATERRAAAVTNLPWTILVASTDGAAALTELASRRRLLLTGLALLLGLVIAGGYFIIRAVSLALLATDPKGRQGVFRHTPPGAAFHDRLIRHG